MTRRDPATARRGESIHAFYPRTVLGSFHSAWQIEAEPTARSGIDSLERSQPHGLVRDAPGPLWSRTRLGVRMASRDVLPRAERGRLFSLGDGELHRALRSRVRGRRAGVLGPGVDTALLGLLLPSHQHFPIWIAATRRPSPASPAAIPAAEQLPGNSKLPTGYAGMLWLAISYYLTGTF